MGYTSLFNSLNLFNQLIFATYKAVWIIKIKDDGSALSDIKGKRLAYPNQLDNRLSQDMADGEFIKNIGVMACKISNY